MLNIFIHIVAILLFFGRFVYWILEEQKTEKTLPKTRRERSLLEITSVFFSRFIFIFITLQLLGVQLFPIASNNFPIQIIGLLLIALGTWICIDARKTLAENWVSGEEYQIKKNQKLITKGIYSSIRHPIYVGLALSFIGAELVVQSYLFISFFAYFIVAYVQGKREEKILLAYFGKQYREYMQRTKMLIPFVL